MRAFGVVMIAALLAGCGQRGPLYMAGERPSSAQPIGGDTLDGNADKDDSSQEDEDPQ